MKNIIKLAFIIAIGIFTISSCKKETNTITKTVTVQAATPRTLLMSWKETMLPPQMHSVYYSINNDTTKILAVSNTGSGLPANRDIQIKLYPKIGDVYHMYSYPVDSSGMCTINMTYLLENCPQAPDTTYFLPCGALYFSTISVQSATMASSQIDPLHPTLTFTVN